MKVWIVVLLMISGVTQAASVAAEEKPWETARRYRIFGLKEWRDYVANHGTKREDEPLIVSEGRRPERWQFNYLIERDSSGQDLKVTLPPEKKQ